MERITPGLIRALLITDPLIILATILMGSLSVLVSLIDADGHKQGVIARWWSKMLLVIAGVRMKVTGLEKLDLNRSYVFASNHVSFMDTPVVLAHIPVQFRFLARHGLFKIPFIGTHLQRAGHLPVPREDPRAAVKVMTQAARIIRERNISMLVFPEGGRSSDGLKPFKEGAAYIAIKAGVPLVPICLTGTHEVLPMGSVHVRAGRVELRIGEPIPTEGLGLADRGTLTDHAREDVVRLLQP
ncbi:MAG: lysophospholipid acyltransferase family protein [Bryobacteraceae bacterium]|nr:lysophospholipid acyltransferase family protein [Bryobacteraceae bacterium]